jgi:hypothetical protein
MEFEFDHTPLQTSVRASYCDDDEDDPFAQDGTHHGEYEEGEDPLNDESVFGFIDEKLQPHTDPATNLSRIHTRHALHSVSSDEHNTFLSWISSDPKAEVFVGPTHTINKSGTLGGYKLCVDAESDCANLPITREIFKGSTCVECDPGDRDIHPDVIRLLSDPAAVRVAILKVLADIQTHEPGMLASLDHMPVAVDLEVPTMTLDDNCNGRERNDILLENLIDERIGRFSAVMKSRDSRSWECDMPSSIGVYHAYVRSRDSGRREHKLFIIASGGCRRASEQYYNMNLDLVGDATASELESCEETRWLRRTSTRSRCRTIKLLADALQLSVPTVNDQFAFEEHSPIPVFTSDTVENDISVADDGRVVLLNNCVDTTSIVNGIICTQQPSEGPWIFLGSHQSSVNSLSNFGGVFGDQKTFGLFPTGTISMYDDIHLSYNPQNTSDSEKNQSNQDIRMNLYKEKSCRHVLYYNPLTGKEVPSEDIDFDTRMPLVKFDDFLVDKLVDTGWDRSFSIQQLIPIINAVEI